AECLSTIGGAHVLATSREPLDVEGEWVHRLEPLGMPASTGRLSLSEAMAYPAIELFVQRARAASSELLFRDDDSDVIADLDPRLDGMPLAMELAAARIDSLGLRGLAARMQELPGLLTRGRRTAPARHRTLHAVLDWSFELLAEVERKVLLRLSAFRAAFT